MILRVIFQTLVESNKSLSCFTTLKLIMAFKIELDQLVRLGTSPTMNQSSVTVKPVQKFKPKIIINHIFNLHKNQPKIYFIIFKY